MKRIILAITIFIAIVQFLHSCSVRNSGLKQNETSLDFVHSANNLLPAYGAFVYSRENCSKCHTQDSVKSGTKISLFGLGGKFSSAWHYWHLMDPQAVNPQSQMPSFMHLNESPINKTTFYSKILGSEVTDERLKDSLWNKLLEQSKVVSKGLEEYDIGVNEPNELLALIAYINTIPGKPKPIAKPVTADQPPIKDSIFWYNNPTLLANLNKPESIQSGKQLYGAYCKVCHGDMQQGLPAIGPNLRDSIWKHGGEPFEIAITISNGIPGRMIGWKSTLNQRDIESLVAFILSLSETKN